jgi:hypothetical protein
MITLRIKSPHIQMHEIVLQKRLYVKVENFGIEVRIKGGLKKGTRQLFLWWNL